MPNHPLALKLLETVGVPMAAPSANLFGQTSPTSAQHVEKDFPNLSILDGGPCDIGIESTVLKLQLAESGRVSLSILRKGIVTMAAINEVLSGMKNQFEWTTVADKKHSPGHMKHHYMPEIPIVFFNQPTRIEDYVSTIENDFKKIPDVLEEVTLVKPKSPIKDFQNLTFSSDASIACRELYGKLKSSAESGAQVLVFQRQPYMTGEVWDAFLERLTKASSLHY
jgi:L-threonylcarbamoyladenylate synthase